MRYDELVQKQSTLLIALPKWSELLNQVTIWKTACFFLPVNFFIEETESDVDIGEGGIDQVADVCKVLQRVVGVNGFQFFEGSNMII